MPLVETESVVLKTHDLAEAESALRSVQSGQTAVVVAQPSPALEAELNHIAGVVTNGLFARRPADVLLLGRPGAVETRLRA